MNRSTRALAAVVTAATLTLTGQAMQSAATAKPNGDGSHGHHGKAAVHSDHGRAAAHGHSAKGEAAKVLRDVARISAALDRAVRGSRIAALSPETQDVLLGSVGTDKGALTTLAGSVTDPGADLRQVRRELRAVRAQNYAQVINILREAAELGLVSTDDLGAVALIESAVSKALDVTAFTPKSDLHAARADLAAAVLLLGGTDDVDVEGEGGVTDGDTTGTIDDFSTMPAIPVVN